MASTLNRQHRLFPTSSNTLTADANPMSSRVPYDLVHGVNNLLYTQPFVAFCASMQSNGRVADAASGPGTVAPEMFCAQFPTVLPDNFKKFCWTLGVVTTGSDEAQTLDAVTVYVSPKVYTGSFADPFDATLLGGSYLTSSVAPAIAIPTISAGDYSLIDNSAGTAGALPYDDKFGLSGWLNWANVIVTVTVSNDDASAVFATNVDLCEFTSWVTYE